MPTYEHQCQACEYIWEDIFKLSEEVPKQCPSCKKKNKIKRLMSSPALGIVELTGFEFKRKVKEDSIKMTKEIYSNENKLANFIGEDKYHSNEISRNKHKNEK